MLMPTKLRAVGLFSGIGNFERAARRLGIHIVAAYELNKVAVQCHRAGLMHTGEDDPGHVHLADITSLASIPQCEIVLAGIPCQPFSQERSGGRALGMDDERGEPLWDNTGRLAADAGAWAIVVENVDGAVGPARTTGAAIMAKHGYHFCKIHVLPASRYGSFQVRNRMWAVYSKFPLEWTPMAPLGASSLSDTLLTLEDFNDDWESYQEALNPCYIGLGTLRMLMRKTADGDANNGFGLSAIPLNYQGTIGGITKSYWKTGGSAPLVTDRCLRCGYQVDPGDDWEYLADTDSLAGAERAWPSDPSHPHGEEALRWPAHLLCGSCMHYLAEAGLYIHDPSVEMQSKVQRFLYGQLESGMTSTRRYHPIEGRRMFGLDDAFPLPDKPGPAFQLLGNSLHVGTAEAVIGGMLAAWPAQLPKSNIHQFRFDLNKIA